MARSARCAADVYSARSWTFAFCANVQRWTMEIPTAEWSVPSSKHFSSAPGAAERLFFFLGFFFVFRDDGLRDLVGNDVVVAKAQRIKPFASGDGL